jgi:hypothetical protein
MFVYMLSGESGGKSYRLVPVLFAGCRFPCPLLNRITLFGWWLTGLDRAACF